MPSPPTAIRQDFTNLFDAFDDIRLRSAKRGLAIIRIDPKSDFKAPYSDISLFWQLRGQKHYCVPIRALSRFCILS